MILLVLAFYYIPLIFLPTMISKTSTLIDIIFSNLTSFEETESGNVTATFSDQLSQFIFLPDFFSKISVTKSNILRNGWKKSESSTFISDFNQIKWKQILLHQSKNLTKRNWNFSPNHGLQKVCKTIKKKKQNLFKLCEVKEQNPERILLQQLQTVEIFYLHSSKGLRNSISQR